jgi:aminomethyltransferase
MKTALYEKHCALGAKIVDFAGWEMPLQYKGITQEHLSVRQGVGIFDVSHMGRIQVSGNEAEILLDYLSTNIIAGKLPLSATYTVWPDGMGGSVDDLIIYKKDPLHFFVVVNAANRLKDLEHLKKYSTAFDVQIEEMFSKEGILAIQGPKAIHVAKKIFPDIAELKPMNFIFSQYMGEGLILSGTGYTGAGGLEIYASNPLIVQLWDRFLYEGQTEGIEPIGLGARDTLRLEMGYALYGHELNDSIAPSESVSNWTIRWKKRDFLGKQRMQQLESSPKKRSEHGIVLSDNRIAREGYEVYQGDKLLGKVTSGSYSPSLNKSIAIILVEGKLNQGEHIEVQIRQNRVTGEVVPLPFYKE